MVGRGPHAALQVGPEQLFAAAQRAEAEGRIGYAVQVYHQLADAFPSSREAYDARDALVRLMPPTADAGYEQPHTGPAAMHAPAQQPYAAPQPQPSLQPPMHLPSPPPRTSHARAPARDLHAPLPAPAHADNGALHAGHHGHAGHAIHPAPVAAPRREPVRRAAPAAPTAAPQARASEVAPSSGPGYRVGRLVAATLTSMGWMLLALTFVVVLLIIATFTVGGVPRGIREALIGQIPLTIAGTVGLFLVSLLAIFAGQTARATFDTAETVRHLLTARDSEGRG
ncbi:MAG: hypothetical protein KGP27_13125 [Hyphomicrobiales bacterium]|nr:hypothetical protein [Hyphomicrobiales bacterium]